MFSNQVALAIHIVNDPAVTGLFDEFVMESVTLVRILSAPHTDPCVGSIPLHDDDVFPVGFRPSEILNVIVVEDLRRGLTGGLRGIVGARDRDGSFCFRPVDRAGRINLPIP